MLNRLMSFFFLKLINPFFLVILTALIAHVLTVEETGKFLLCYALCVIFSSITDGGSRITHFAEIRSGNKSTQNLYGSYLESFLIKVKFSFILMPVVPVVLYFITGEVVPVFVLTLWLYAVTFPIGDPAWIVWRGVGDVKAEIKLNTIEQIFVIVGILLLNDMGCVSVASIFILMATLGFFRFVIAQTMMMTYLERRLVGVVREALSEVKSAHNVKRQIWPTLSILISQCFNRAPIILATSYMSSLNFVVFSAFFTVFLRGELLLSGIIQSFWAGKGRAPNKFFELKSLMLMGVVLGGAVFILSSIFKEELVSIYLGGDYVQAAQYLLFPAVYVCFYYPFFVLRADLMFGGSTKFVSICLLLGIFVQISIVKLAAGHGEYAQLLSFPFVVFIITIIFSVLSLRSRI